MRKKLMVTLALSAVLVAGAAAIANAASFTVKEGNLVVTFGGDFSPKAMPKNRYVPVKSSFFGKIKTDNGSHPSALREVVFDVDKDVKIDVRGLPVCKPGQLEARNTAAAKRVCGKTTLGAGLAHAEISFPEQRPIKVASPITIFNGGGNASKTKLLIHTFITVPVPAAIVTQVTVQKRGTGIHSIAKIPVIAGGSGSVLDYRFNVRRTYKYKGRKTAYVSLKCPDGKFRASVKKILFRNETNEPGVAPQTVLSGSLSVPCRPKG